MGVPLLPPTPDIEMLNGLMTWWHCIQCGQIHLLINCITKGDDPCWVRCPTCHEPMCVGEIDCE